MLPQSSLSTTLLEAIPLLRLSFCQVGLGLGQVRKNYDSAESTYSNNKNSDFV